MELSTAEIKVLEQIAIGNKAIKTIALALNKSDKQIYVIAKKIADKGLIERINGKIEPKTIPHMVLLLQLLAKTKNTAPVLSGSGIPIFTALLKPLNLTDLMDETGFTKTTVYRKIEEARKRSLLKKRVSTYQINEKMWSILRDFLEELKKFEATTDKRIPLSSTIYHKKNDEIIFSCKEEVDAKKTAFSAYEEYGIKLLTIKNYYYLPKKNLTKQDILKHSLYIIEKDHSIAYIIYLTLFYVKYREEFEVKHEILMNINAILAGGKIKGYPSYQEIKDRAEVYNIKV